MPWREAVGKAARAAGVAAERARCLAIVAEVETRRYRGAAINACRDIADAIRESK